MIIRTAPYTIQEIAKILAIRAEAEGVKVDDDALAELSRIGETASLRYAMQMLTPSSILARINGRAQVTKNDVLEATLLFLDSKTSAKFLKENPGNYMEN